VNSVVGSRNKIACYSEAERRNIRLVREFLAIPKPLAPEARERLGAFSLRRLGMLNLAELFGESSTDATASSGYDANSFADRQDQLVDVIAHGDCVWALWRMVGTHTGQFWGMPGTGQSLDLLEVGIFRIENDRIVEGWFMNDELAICRQLGIRALGEVDSEDRTSR
jgi:hypothetical protein